METFELKLEVSAYDNKYKYYGNNVSTMINNCIDDLLKDNIHKYSYITINLTELCTLHDADFITDLYVLNDDFNNTEKYKIIPKIEKKIKSSLIKTHVYNIVFWVTICISILSIIYGIYNLFYSIFE